MKMHAKKHAGDWEGGYININSKGVPTFYIRLSVGGKRYEISTGANDLAEARRHLAAFERDPSAYAATRDLSTKGLALTESLIEKYCEATRAAGRTPEYIVSIRGYLTNFWMKELAGKDLRALNVVTDVKAALVGKKAVPHKIRCLKAFYTWLRQEAHLVKPSEDCTLHVLRAPQASRSLKSKAVKIDDILKIRPFLPPKCLHLNDVLMGTAWHIREVKRWLTTGGTDLLPEGNEEEFAVMSVLAKRRNIVRTRVSRKTLQAAEALRALGWVGDDDFRRELTLACAKAGVERIRPGVYRHSVLHHAIEAGASLEAVATFANHANQATTKKFYVGFAVPAKVPTMTF